MPEYMPDRECQIECQNIYQIDMPDRMPEDLPDRMPDRLSEDMPDGMPDRYAR